MAKSGRLRLADVRAGFRVVGDCRDVGRDGGAWRRRLMDGLCGLVRGQFAVGLDTAPTFGTGGPPGPHVFPAGWPDDAQRRLWQSLYLEQQSAPRDITFQRFFATPGGLVVRRREEVVAGPEWERSEELTERRRPIGVDDLLMARLPLPGGGLFVVTVCRPTGDRGFAARDAALCRLVLEEAGRLVGGPLTRSPADPAAGLTPRTREVLDLLLAGASEKEVAAALGISPHTVHGHVKVVYQHFGVGTRAELLARAGR